MGGRHQGQQVHFALKAVFICLALLATLAAMATPVVNPSLWTTAPTGKARGKGQAQQRGGGKSPANRQQAGEKGQKRSQSKSREQPVGAPAGGKGGYFLGNNSKKARLPLESYPFGTGATQEDIRLLADGSPYPGIAATDDRSPSSTPMVFEWVPCLNQNCPAPCRTKPPYSRAGVSNYAIVSNSKVRCHFCLVEILPIDSQRIVELFQPTLIAKLGGNLGPLHPKFKGSKIYIQAEKMLRENEQTADPSMPPLHDLSHWFPASGPPMAEATAASSWLPASGPPQAEATATASTQPNVSEIGQWLAAPANRFPKPTSSDEAVQSAKLSLLRLETAIAHGQVDAAGLANAGLDYATLSRQASEARLDIENQGNSTAPASSAPDLPRASIYHYLLGAIKGAQDAGETDKAEDLKKMLEKDFPTGEPQKPVPPPVQLSPSHELNLLASKSAQALRDLTAARKALEVCRDRVMASQSQLDEAKQQATVATAEVQSALLRYRDADSAVRDFNSKIAAKEMEKSAKIVEQVAAASPSTPKDTVPNPVKAEQATYATVAAKGVKGKGKQTLATDPVLPPVPATKRSEDGKPKGDLDDDMDGNKSDNSQVISNSKKIKREADALELERSNDADLSGQLQLDPNLVQNEEYMCKLANLCHKYSVTQAQVIEDAAKGENTILARQQAHKEQMLADTAAVFSGGGDDDET